MRAKNGTRRGTWSGHGIGRGCGRMLICMVMISVGLLHMDECPLLNLQQWQHNMSSHGGGRKSTEWENKHSDGDRIESGNGQLLWPWIFRW